MSKTQLAGVEERLASVAAASDTLQRERRDCDAQKTQLQASVEDLNDHNAKLQGASAAVARAGAEGPGGLEC